MRVVPFARCPKNQTRERSRPSGCAYPPRQIPEFKRGVGRNNERLEGSLWGIWRPFHDRLEDPCYPPCAASRIDERGIYRLYELPVPFVR